MGSHSVTFHPTQANTPRLYLSQTGWYSIYLPTIVVCMHGYCDMYCSVSLVYGPACLKERNEQKNKQMKINWSGFEKMGRVE